MHDNANIAFQLQETTSIYDTVLSLQPKVGGGGGEGEKSPEEIVDDYAAGFEEVVRKFACILVSGHPTTSSGEKYLNLTL